MDSMDKYRQWLSDFQEDAELVRELRAIEGDPQEIEERFYTELEFGTAGMRGVLGAGPNRMNAQNVRRTTQGLADFLKGIPGAAERGVAIGYDSRRLSTEFALEAALVLCANGVRAHLFDELRPVALLSFAVRYLGAAAGIVITASHNPKEYNGYKVYGEDGGQFPPDKAKDVIGRIAALSYTDAQTMARADAEAAGLLHTIGAEIDDEYQRRVRALCVNPELCRDMGERLRVVYTPLNGSGNKPVRRILASLGFERVSVVEVQADPDPEFTTVGVPNPENRQAFALAIEQAEREDADLVFGTDPDCDRLGVVCRVEGGEYVFLNGNQIGCLLLHYILENKRQRGELPKNGAAVKSIVSTEMGRAIAESYGAEMIDVLTGFKFIAEKIQEFEDTGSHAFLFGFEESYGYLMGSFVRDKDAVIASMLLAECAAWYKSRGKTVYEGLQELFSRYGYYVESNEAITLPGKNGVARMREIMASLRRNPPAALGGFRVEAVRDYLAGTRVAGGVAQRLTLPESDALYYELDRGAWVAIRPSGTEPKIRVYCNVREASAQAAQRENEALRAAVAKLIEEA